MEPTHIYCGKADLVLRRFPEASVDLIYADPPFFTQKNYEIIWDDGYERRAYDDRWKAGGGASGVENYISWLEPAIRECHRVLKPTGTLYLHCDYRANYRIRELLDRVFGESQFRNEIIWCYAGGGIPKKDFPRKHDTIFRYTKSADWAFNKEYRPYKEGIIPTHSDGTPLDLKKGTPIPEWWTDINIVTPFSARKKERLGYPTQKPEALLERIVRVSSDPTDLVLDPFCGCGTAIAVAQKLGRRWIGIDISPTACKLMLERMRKLIPKGEADFGHMIIGLPMTYDELKAIAPFEFQNWVVQKLGGRVAERKVGDYGIDGYDLGGFPVQVKQSERVGRNVVDNFETAMRRFKKDRGTIVGLSFGKGAYGEAARAKNQEGLEITLLTLNDLLDMP